MNRIYSIAYIILMLVFGYWASDAFRQERAKLKYANPKYIRNVTVFTGRKSRHDPYLTNMTGTILMPYGNNVSFATTLTLRSGGDFRIVAKACDTIKSKWMNEYMSSFTNLTLDTCPFPPATYAYINMELPPKNIPIPLADGDYIINFELFITATKEPILEINILLHFDQNARKSQLKQERATINHCNPTYMKECYAITRRVRRGEPYKTNVTIITRYASGNNVTFKVVLMSGLAIEVLKTTVCDFHSIDWFSEFVNRYSNVNGTCPYKAGKYELYDIELPPKNFPKRFLNLLKGKLYAKFYFVTTETEELMFEATLIISSLAVSL